MADTTLVAGPRPIVAVARVILWAFFGIALAVGLACLISGGIAIGQHLASGYTQLTLVADKPLPKQLHPAPLFSEINGSYPTATLQARGLSGTIVALVTTAAIATVLIQVSLSALIALLSWRLLRGGLFRRSISRAVSAAGVILAVGGMISQAGVAIAAGAAASELNGGGNGFWPLAGRFDPTLTVFGIVLLLVGLAFEYGTRLQNETEGLV
jgi:hypothetical protein